MMRRVYVGIGSNLGDREFLIRKAVESGLVTSGVMFEAQTRPGVPQHEVKPGYRFRLCQQVELVQDEGHRRVLRS